MSLDIGKEERKSASIGRPVRQVFGRKTVRARKDTEGATAQTSQINVTATQNTTTYSVRFQGKSLDETVPVTTDGTATQEKLRDLLVAAIEANPALMAFVDSVVAGVNLLIVTWKEAVPTVTVNFPTNPSTDLTLTTVASAAAPQYLYGQAAEVRSVAAQPPLLTSGVRRPVEISGEVLGVSITHSGGETFQVVYLIDGGSTTVGWAAGANADATDLLAETALEGALPAGTDVTVDSTGELTVTFTPGVSVSIVSGSGTGAADVSTAVDSAADPLPKFCLVIDDFETPPVDSIARFKGPAIGPYPGTAPQTADSSGGGVEWAVASPGIAVSDGDPVYVEADSGDADYGLLKAAPSLTRIPWLGMQWVTIDPQDPNLAHVRY